MQSLIRDINLATEGRKKIDWVSNFMPTLNTLGDRFEAEQTFKGQTIVVSVHLEAKTAYLSDCFKTRWCRCYCNWLQSVVYTRRCS